MKYKNSTIKYYFFVIYFKICYYVFDYIYKIILSIAILDWIKLLSGLSDEERSNLSMFCQEKRISSWDIIFHEDDYATAMYILKEGNIEVSRKIDWWKIILWEVHAEEILWEMALFWERNKRMATASALTDGVLITILMFSIKELTEKHPELLDKIKMIINDRMISNKEKIN